MKSVAVRKTLRKYLSPGLERRRLLMAVAGVAVCGVSVAFFKHAMFGVDPFQCFCGGLNKIIPISFGTLYTFINLALLAAVFFLMDRRLIGPATFVNLFLLGYLVEFCQKLLQLAFPAPSLWGRIAFLLIGIVVMCYASALYFTADLGVSTYDAIALFLASKKIAPFRFIRIGTDLLCVVSGALMGQKPGAGTLITAFFMGPLISFFNRRCAEPMLYGNSPRPAREEKA